MAIIISNDGDKVVNTITERNALPNRFIGMNVTVNDATGDPAIGTGSATYIWLDVNGIEQWVTASVSDGTILEFVTEKKVLAGGIVTANNVPVNGAVWTVRILDATGVIVGDISPVVTQSTIDIGTLEYDGLTLEYTYAYGSFTAQLSQVLGDLVDKAVALVDANIDLNLGALYSKTIIANTAFTITNPAPAGEVSNFVLELTDAGSFAVSWPAGTIWEGGVSPTLSATGKDVLAFYSTDGGVTWVGLVVGIDVRAELIVT